MNHESNFMMIILSGTITTIWKHQWQPPPPMSTKWSRPAAAQPRAIATSGRPPYRDSPTRCGPWRGGGTWRRGCRLIFKYFWYFRNISFFVQATPAVSLDGSSIHSRSRTGSPCPSNCGKYEYFWYFRNIFVLGSPIQRQSYNWEMFETLNRPNPPSYSSLPRGGHVDSWPRQYLV